MSSKTFSVFILRFHVVNGKSPFDPQGKYTEKTFRWFPVRTAQSQNLMFINIINGSLDETADRCYSLRITYLIFETFQTHFPTALLIFTAVKVFIKWNIRKLFVETGGWNETLNLLHVSRCEMLHFVTSYMKQNKSGKQTLESAQYGLEISFKLPDRRSL